MFSKSKIMVAFIASSSSLVFAGAMGGIESSSTKLLLEVGGTYSHFFYKKNVTSPEARTLLNPAGYQFNPADYFPNDFGGGYLGVSIYRNSWLMNMRYDMFALKGKNNILAGSFAHEAPEKLAFTVDKTWQSTMPFVYGIGGGVALTTYNEGQIYVETPLGDGTFGKSYHGRTRFAPLVEAVAMYSVTDNVNLRFNLAYQIPVTEVYYNGALTANLGINYSVPL